MAQDKIQFNNAVLDETLYLLPDSAKLTISLNNANQLPFLTGDKVSTLLICSPDSGNEIAEETLVSLHKLAAAVKLSPQDYAILNVKNFPNFRFNHLLDYPQIKNVVCFGIPGEVLGLHLDYYIYNSFYFNNISTLMSDSMKDMNPDNKKRLWHALQIMYKLKL
jgi:hypothetical protein